MEHEKSALGRTGSAASPTNEPPEWPPNMASVSSCPFPQPTRLVTGHNESTKEAVFDNTFAPQVDPQHYPGVVFYNCYTLPSITPSSLPSPADASPGANNSADLPPASNPSPTSTLPASITANVDLSFYASHYPAMEHLDLPAGAVFRFLDFAPGAMSPLHRTQTVDFGFVLEGAVEAVMDSGETRLMERGSVIVQRGTMHGWREATGTQWARVGFVLLGMGTEGIRVPAAGGAQKKKEDSAGETGWKAEKAATSSGTELKPWIPWELGVPLTELRTEVSETIEKGKKEEKMKSAEQRATDEK